MSETTEVRTSPAAVATAEWWADKVFGGAVGAIDSPESNDLHTSATMALGLVAGAQGVPAEPSKREQFVTHLARYVERMLDDSRYGVTLATDYGPEGELARLADYLHLGGSFPWKTVTWTYPTHLVTSMGYGAADRIEWHAEGWEPPPCNQQQWDLSKPDGGRLPWRCSAPRYHTPDEHVFDVPDPLCTAQVDRFGKPEVCGRSRTDETHDPNYWCLPHEFTPAAGRLTMPPTSPRTARLGRARVTEPAPDHCTCPPSQPCACGFAAMLTGIFFGEVAR